MVFSSLTFIYFFLPLVIILYYLVPGTMKNVFLLVASVFFYFWGSPRYVPLLIMLCMWTFIIGIDIPKREMKEKGKLKSWWQVAILYRTNSQSQNFESLFIQEGIPYKIYWAFKFFERKEIKDILAFLKVVNNPFDWVSLKRILNIPNRKIWLLLNVLKIMLQNYD